tara:strand:+ start:681 stop:938 length:258 start_codon:yes stop_codon:yes gene_type:complete
MFINGINNKRVLVRHRLILYGNNKKDSHFKKFDEKEPMVIESNETHKDKYLLQSPCEYFIFFSIMSIWFGSYVRRKLYYLLKNNK